MTETEPVAFPFPPEQRGEIRPVYAERRAQCPMGRVHLPSGHDAVLLVRHEDVVAGPADSRLSHELTAPDLIAARDGQDTLSEDELLIMVIGLIAAGNETTSNALGRSVLTLLSHDRSLWQELLERPDRVPEAVDELLRHSMVGNGLLRQAVEDVDLPSGTVRKGDAVVLSLESAGFDESVYPDPHAVLFDREPPTQVIFGGGPHYCLGAHLAKAELRTGLGLLLERLPTLRLDVADPATLRYTEGDVLSSLVSLPVAWWRSGEWLEPVTRSGEIGV